MNTTLPHAFPPTLFTTKPIEVVVSARQRTTFQTFINDRYRKAGAVTPEERLAVLITLRDELLLEGKFPHEGTVIQVPVQHPVIQALFAGKPINVGGNVLGGEKVSLQSRAQNLGTGAKIAIMAGIGMGLIALFLGGAFLLRQRPAPSVAVVVTPSVTAAATLTPVVSVTPFPVTATPYSISFITGDAASQAFDPASIEIGGFSYVLSVGQVHNGEWAPTGAEWLYGTSLRRVIAIPYEPDLVNTLNAMTAGSTVQLRLRNGEVVEYQVTQVGRVPRQQIEVMVDREPSIAVILHGEPTPDRWVLVGQAVQAVTSQTGDTAMLPPLPDTNTPPTSSTPTISVSVTPPLATGSAVARVTTDTLPLYHPQAGITLEVSQCQRVNQIGEQTPPQRRQQFVLCQITLTAAPTNTAPVPYTAEAFALSEQSWLATSTDWWPPNVSVSGGLRSGTLNPGMATTGRIGGLLLRASGSSNTSTPVLVWEQAGIRYSLTLPESVWQP